MPRSSQARSSDHAIGSSCRGYGLGESVPGTVASCRFAKCFLSSGRSLRR